MGRRPKHPAAPAAMSAAPQIDLGAILGVLADLVADKLADRLTVQQPAPVPRPAKGKPSLSVVEKTDADDGAPEGPADDDLATLKETQSALGIGQTMIFTKIKSGEIRAVRLGARATRIPWGEIRRVQREGWK